MSQQRCVAEIERISNRIRALQSGQFDALMESVLSELSRYEAQLSAQWPPNEELKRDAQLLGRVAARELYDVDEEISMSISKLVGAIVRS